MTKIGIIGAGNIGGTLGTAWAKTGHPVMFGVRDPQSGKVQRLLYELGSNLRIGKLEEAAAFGEVVLFAVPGPAMDAAITACAPGLAGKVIIDSANKVGGPVMNSLATFAQVAPTAQVFRAFNNLGWENFANPSFSTGQADLFFCGPDGAAREMMEGLIEAVGLRPMWVGGPEQAPLVDNLTRLWFTLASRYGRHTAFKLLHD